MQKTMKVKVMRQSVSLTLYACCESLIGSRRISPAAKTNQYVKNLSLFLLSKKDLTMHGIYFFTQLSNKTANGQHAGSENIITKNYEKQSADQAYCHGMGIDRTNLMTN